MKYRILLLALIAVLVGLLFATNRTGSAGETMRLEELANKTHMHGIAVDSADPVRLYLVTHHGFYVLSVNGNATRLSDNGDDYMGFTPHPTDPSVFYASGHPARGGNTGFI